MIITWLIQRSSHMLDLVVLEVHEFWSIVNEPAAYEVVHGLYEVVCCCKRLEAGVVGAGPDQRQPLDLLRNQIKSKIYGVKLRCVSSVPHFGLNVAYSSILHISVQDARARYVKAKASDERDIVN